MQDVRIPEHEIAATAIERAGFFSEAIDRIARSDSARDQERIVELKIASRVAGVVPVVLEDQRAVFAVSLKPERPFRDAQTDRFGLEQRLVGAVLQLEVRRFGQSEASRKRGAFVEVSGL